MGNPGNQRDYEPVHFRLEVLPEPKNVFRIWQTKLIHFLFPHLYLEEGSEVIPHQGEEVKSPARQGPGLVAEIRTQEDVYKRQVHG